ncbi:MAG TPA: tetratricopeptide repeat protein [Pyrinomonadaceae bacterium]|nr:tetratricopeptide repeat protein [Pyrinomonadaceae bacterium]
MILKIGRSNHIQVKFALGVLVLVLCAGTGILKLRAQQKEPGAGEVALKKGDYETALKQVHGRLSSDPNDQTAQRNLTRVYLETGRFTEAETAARKFVTKNPQASSVRHELGEALAATGRYAEAAVEFERASNGSDLSPGAQLLSRLRLGEMLEFNGQLEKARTIYETFVQHYTDADPQTSEELTAIARALVHLERYQDANDMYRSAIEADAENLEAQLGAAELFTQKYNYSDAAQFLEAALQINPNSARAHLDVARNKRLEGGEAVSKALEQALKINPNLVDAIALKTALTLEEGDFSVSSSEIERALKINPNALEVHGLRAAQLYLEDRDYNPEITATLAINKNYGEIYNILSHYATITRRTEQAAQFARQAIQTSPELWDGHLSLGMALLRLGQMDQGRAEVEVAFKGDPFNLWAKNTLDLLDTMADFHETKRGSFIVKTSAQESAVVPVYALNLLEEASAKLTQKYHFTPRGPVAIEIFPNHEDFAVRTLGIPGLGALGVCFGMVIAQDSPSARRTGEFNWGSTLWHEYTHVITLQMTDYRIPRWFSEGLSVYEERRARPGWGDDWNPLFIRSFAEGKWFKIAELNGGFQNPRTPQDIAIAYFEASQVCEFIVERFGFDSILRMLTLYREKAKTPEVIAQVLKLTETQFDKEFSAYIDGKAQPMQKALKTEANLAASLSKEEVLKLLETQETFALHLRAAQLLAADGKTDEAATHYARAIELVPYITGEGNPYQGLAQLYEQKGQNSRAAEVLESLVGKDENDIEALKAIARLRLADGDKQHALAALQASFFISPFDYAAHTKAGELSAELNNNEQALSEFKVALGLQPPNIAEANFNVAGAYFALGRHAEAKKSVLRALEAAPRYEKAQELLLRITGQ